MVHSKQNSKAAAEVDENLKKVFQPTLEEDLPDRFKSLLAQLKGDGAQPDSAESRPEDEE